MCSTWCFVLPGAWLEWGSPWAHWLWDSPCCLTPLAQTGWTSWEVGSGAGHPTPQAFHGTWLCNPCLEVLAASALGARIHPKNKTVFMWRKARPSKSIHSIPHVCWWEVAPGGEGCLQGPGPGVPLACQEMFSPLERG